MNTSRTSPMTLSHSAARPYVVKLEEYAHSAAGHGRQHVGVPGKRSMGAQNRPDVTLNDISKSLCR